MKHILVLGAGKSSTSLIEYLLANAMQQDWYVHVADVQIEVARSKTGNDPRAIVYAISPDNDEETFGLSNWQTLLFHSCHLIFIYRLQKNALKPESIS